MNKVVWYSILGVVAILLTMATMTSVWNELYEKSQEVEIFDVVHERIDVIISDKVPIGCFIPPDYTEGEFNNLPDICKKVLKGNNIEWGEISGKLENGIKLDGYCFNCIDKTCLCLGEDIYGWNSEEFPEEMRSLEFGDRSTIEIGESSYTITNFQPSVFVVKPNKDAKLSLYAGIYNTGNKTVEKITGRILNTDILADCTRLCKNEYSDEEYLKCREGCKFANSYIEVSSDCNVLSDTYKHEGCINYANLLGTQPTRELIGKERNCYIGDKLNCYSNCRIAKDDKKCREECDCYLDQRYYEEEPVEICKNYCDSKDFPSVADPDKISDCKLGCDYGKSRDLCVSCIVKYGELDKCNSVCSGVPNYEDLINNLCGDLADDVKKGCEKYLYFKNSVFRVNSGEYKIVKIGNFNAGLFRGPAFASIQLTARVKLSGISCYSEKKFPYYFHCCEEVCRGEEEDCTCQDTCSKIANCSIESRISSSDPFTLCKNFCISRDGFFGEEDKIKRCIEGCDWANRLKSANIRKIPIDVVFVVDTTGSMNEEWDTLCSVMSGISSKIEKDIDAKFDIYALDSCSHSGSESCVTNRITPVSGDDNCKCESWGDGTEYLAKNYEWRENSKRIIIPIGDEGPHCGVPYDSADENSIENAISACKENNVSVYGMWGIMPSSYKDDIINAMKKLSEETGGVAVEFTDSDTLTEHILKAIGESEEFMKGYYKYLDLTKEENTVLNINPYIWKIIYEKVYSNLFYIVNYSSGSCSGYCYTLSDKKHISTPSGSREINYYSLLDKI